MTKPAYTVDNCYTVNCVRIPIEEAIQEFGLPADCGDFGKTLILTDEAVQDHIVRNKTIFSDRTGPIMPDEAAGWREAATALDDPKWWAAAKGRVTVVTDFVPYGDYT